MKRIIFYLSAFCLIVTCTTIHSQTKKAYERHTQKAIEDNNHFEALSYLKILLEIDDSRMDWWYAYGEAARNIYSYKLAEMAYERVSMSPEKSNYPMTDFWLGMMEKNLGKYEEAKGHFQKYLNEMAPNDYFYKRANREIRSCEWARENIQTQANEDLTIVHLEGEVNSPYTEFGAVEINDTLYYSALKFTAQDKEPGTTQYISKILRTTGIEKEEILEAPFNRNDFNAAHYTLNRNGDRLYFNRCRYINAFDLRCELYQCEKLPDGGWSDPEPLPDIVNMKGYTSTQPSLGYDEESGREILYFVSNRPGGKGKLDIWFSLLYEDGGFSQPINLTPVNTEDNEVSPFYHTPSQMLYFSSDGYIGYGGFDIFRTLKGGKSMNWMSPEHMGYPLNSSYNDIYYSLNESSSKAFFSSNRPGSLFLDEETESCCNDIYQVTFENVVLELYVSAYDRKSNIALENTTLELLDLTWDYVQSQDNPEYRFSHPLERDREYKAMVKKPGYKTDTFQLNTLGVIKSKDYFHEAYLTPLQLNLLALTFDAESSEPLPGAKVELHEPSEQTIAEDRNYESNDFHFPLDPNKKRYIIIAQKEGYTSDTIELALPEIIEFSDTLIRKLYLNLKPSNIMTLVEFLPLPMYFDNDEPDQDTWATTTEKTYSEAYIAYYEKKEVFKEEYSKGLNGEEKIRAQDAINRFFEEEVQLGYKSLESFFEHLHDYLMSGEKAELLIKGFASPRAASSYNAALSKRRTTSLKNEILAYNNGAFKAYIDNGQLKISEKPLGESKSPRHVSDNLSDLRGSIYSIEASRERRVEIIKINK